jgi:hypothetical protein
MQKEEYEKKYDEARKFYWSIKYIICPDLDGEKIIFNGIGWRHLVFKNGKTRSIDVQLKRFQFLYSVKEVVLNGKIIEYREEIENGRLAKFWKIEYLKVRVLVRQFHDRSKHFFSIMD